MLFIKQNRQTPVGRSSSPNRTKYMSRRACYKPSAARSNVHASLSARVRLHPPTAKRRDVARRADLPRQQLPSFPDVWRERQMSPAARLSRGFRVTTGIFRPRRRHAVQNGIMRLHCTLRSDVMRRSCAINSTTYEVSLQLKVSISAARCR